VINRIIFDVGHPAQVHNFKYVSRELSNKGWEVLFTAKDKEITKSLLDLYNLPNILIGRNGKNIPGKMFRTIFTFLKFFKILIIFKPDLVICRFSIHSCWCCKLLKIPVIGLADTEHTKFSDKLTVPFATVKITSDSYTKNLGKNHIRIKGNIELYYLHPNRFSSVSSTDNDFKTEGEKPIVILRFVSWTAHHDIGEKGILLNMKTELVKTLEKKYTVLITSENNLPEHLLKYRVTFTPDKIHNVLSQASLYIGEGASMASEAACLGVYAVYINSLEVGYVKEEEKFNLAVSLRNSQNLLSVIQELINDDELENRTKQNLKAFLADKIDPTAFLVWFIENYPESLRIMKEDPGYQERFR